MAEFTTTDTQEIVHDRVCTTVKVEEPGTDQQDKKIEVKIIAEVDPNEGCTDQDTRKFTLCLRPVKDNNHANDDNYRTYQVEAETIIKAEEVDAVSKLQEIQMKWIANPNKNHVNTKIPEMLTKI